jgi:hypothetical protein
MNPCKGGPTLEGGGFGATGRVQAVVRWPCRYWANAKVKGMDGDVILARQQILLTRDRMSLAGLSEGLRRITPESARPRRSCSQFNLSVFQITVSLNTINYQPCPAGGNATVLPRLA